MLTLLDLTFKVNFCCCLWESYIGMDVSYFLSVPLRSVSLLGRDDSIMHILQGSDQFRMDGIMAERDPNMVLISPLETLSNLLGCPY